MSLFCHCTVRRRGLIRRWCNALLPTGPYFKQNKVHAFSTVLFKLFGGLRPPRSLNKTVSKQCTLSITCRYSDGCLLCCSCCRFVSILLWERFHEVSHGTTRLIFLSFQFHFQISLWFTKNDNTHFEPLVDRIYPAELHLYKLILLIPIMIWDVFNL